MKVLIAIDEEAFAKPLADFVLMQEWPGHTEFLILNVIEPITASMPAHFLPAPILSEVKADMANLGERTARALALRLQAALHTQHLHEKVVEGHPKEKILETAKEWEADMIVVGSHGRRGLERLMLGSVSSAVVGGAPCSVLVVRMPRKLIEAGRNEQVTRIAAGNGF